MTLHINKAIRELKTKLTSATDVRDRITILSKLLQEYLFVSESEGARDYADELLSLSRHVRNKKNEIAALIFLGSLDQNNGSYERALNYYSEALSIARLREDTHDILHALNCIGSIYFMLDRYDKVLK